MFNYDIIYFDVRQNELNEYQNKFLPKNTSFTKCYNKLIFRPFKMKTAKSRCYETPDDVSLPTDGEYT